MNLPAIVTWLCLYRAGEKGVVSLGLKTLRGVPVPLNKEFCNQTH